MNDERIKLLHETLVSQGFITDGTTLDEFKVKIKSDPDYASSVSDLAISESLYTQGGKEDFEKDYFSFSTPTENPDVEAAKVEPKEEKISVETITKGFDEVISLLSTDDSYEPTLKGKARKDEIERIKKEREKAVSNVQDNESYLVYANKLEEIRKNSLPTEEEIQAVDAELPLTNFVQQIEQDQPMSDVDRLQQQIESGMASGETTSIIPSAPQLAMNISQANKEEAAEDIMNIEKKAIQMGYTILKQGEKVPADADPSKVIYKPDSFTATYNVQDVFPQEVLDSVLYDKKKEIARQLKLEAYREELDEVLTEFEAEEGVTAVVGHILGTIAEGQDWLSEKVLSGDALERQRKISEGFHEYVGTDKSYMDARQSLQDIMTAEKQSENYQIDAANYAIETANDNLNIISNDLRNLEERIKAGEQLTASEINQYNLLRESYNNQIDIANKAMIRLGNLTVDSGNFDEIKDRTLKTYSTLSVYGNNIGSSAVRLVAGLATLRHELTVPQLLKWSGIDINNANTREIIAESFDNFIGTDFGDEIQAGLKFISDKDKAVEDAIKGMHKYSKEITDENRQAQEFDKISNPLEFLAWGGEMLSNQAINIGINVVSGGTAGLVIMAAGEAGNKMYDMNVEMEGEMWSDTPEGLAELEKIKEYNKLFEGTGYEIEYDETYKVKPKDVSAAKYFGTSLVYGAAEFLSEKITLGNLKFAGNNIKKVFKGEKPNFNRTFDLSPSTKRVDIDLLPKTTKDLLKEWAPGAFKGTISEAGAEGLVTLSQNAADIYMLGNEDISLFDGVTESMVSGAFMNSTFQSPVVLSMASKAFMGDSQAAKVASLSSQMLQLSKKRDELAARKMSLKGSNPLLLEQLQKEESEIQAEIFKLGNQQLENINLTDNAIQSFTKQDRQELIDIFNRQHTAKVNIRNINNNTALTVKEKDALIKDQLDILIKQDAIKERIITNSMFEADKKRSRDFANAWRTTNGTLDMVETIAGKDNQEALQKGLQFIDSNTELSAEEKNQVKQQLQQEFNRAEAESSGGYTVHGMAFGDGLKIQSKDADGNTVEKTVNIPINFAMGTGNASVQSHEMGHQTVFKGFMKNNPNAIGLVADMESYVKKNYPEAYQIFKDTESSYEGKNQAEIAEEKLAALSDLMRKKNIKGMRSLHNKLFGRFQKFNDGSSPQIKNGKDVFDMLTSYNQSFETGQLTGLAKAIAEGKAEVTPSKKSMTKSQEAKMKESLRQTSTRLSKGEATTTKMSAAEKAEVESKLNEIPGAKGPDGNYLMNQTDWQADKDRALSKAITIAMDGTLDGLIVDKMASGDTIHGLSRDEFMNRVYTKLGMHVFNFNPQSSRSLFGWINSYIGNRVGDVANQAKRQKVAPGPTVSTSKKIGDEGGKTIAETIKGDDADTIIAAVDATMNKQDVAIDNLRTRLGIEKGGPLYNAVIAAVEKTFGRTKLKDVSNIKFKQDLKNKFNTELFKTVKNSLGTRAAYKNFIEGDIIFKDKDGKTVEMPRIKMLFDYFAQEVFNKRFETFKEKLIDPETGKQARPENNPLFRKRKNITKKELVDYFLGSDVGASTKGTRKDSLASAIAEELAFDATMEVLEDPAIQNKIKDFYELQGLRQAENFLEKVGKIIDRTPGSKFSKTKTEGQVSLRQDQVITEVKNLNEFLNSKEQDIRDGKDLSEIIDSYINKQDVQVKEALSKYVSKLKQIASKHKGTPITLDTFKKLREGDAEATLKFVPSMPAFIKEQSKIENFELKTEAGTEQYFDFITDLTSIMDPSFTNSSIFKTTIGRGGKKIFYDSKTGGVKRLNTNEADSIISKGKKEKLKFDPNKAIAISSSQYNKIDSLMKSYTVDQRNDPKIQKKIAKQVTDILGKDKMEAIQAARDYLYNKLNEYVKSQKTEIARNKAIANVAKLLEIQSSLTGGIPRQGAVPTTISIQFSEVAKKKKRDGTEVSKLYHKEHNLPQVVFNANVLASIIDGNFDQVYPQISKTYNQSILDTDIQLAQDYGLVSKEFYAKYPSAKLINTGRTAEMTGYEMGMDSEALFVVATGNAPLQLDLKTGLTLDKVIYNKLGAKDVLSYIGKVADMINEDLSKAPMSKVILNPKNKEAIFSSKENSNLFNEIITNSVNDQSIDVQAIELGIKLENKEIYDQRDEVNNEQLNKSKVTQKFSKSKNTTKEVIDESKILDKALSIARDPNAPVKKIRVFDFDDTLAKSKSLVFYNRPNESGKPVPKNKAIFMIGGPGSGKTNIGKGLELGREGWKVVNQDIFIEQAKKEAGLPEVERGYTKEQKSQRAKIGAAGVKAAQTKLDKYTKAGDGMVIDGTGASYNATMKKVKALQDQGYEVFMVHAKTSNEVALERNKARKERSLPDFIVERTQESVNNNIPKYKNDLGDAFIEIDTETLKYGEALPKDFVNEVKSKVYATERGRLNAEEFAQQGESLVEQGFAMDFSDFNIVREGERGPLFEVAEKIRDARGVEDIFVLTARAPQSAQAIQEFLKSEGLNLPIENITGLGNSSPLAKSNWIVNKAAEGYNDFYFADDAIKNVDAVKRALDVIDVKSSVQQAKAKFSKTVDQTFNDIIEHKTGIKSESEYAEVKARLAGRKKGKFKFFMPPSAEDFVGLLYKLLGKGEIGEMQLEWFKEHLIEPYNRGLQDLDRATTVMMNDFKEIKKQLKESGLVPKNLNKKALDNFTFSDIARILAWQKSGYDIPGLSQTDLKKINEFAKNNPALDLFADKLIQITKGDGYGKPGKDWLAGNIAMDMMDTMKIKRQKYLEQWKQNVDIIFSEKNLNKLEAAFGNKYREAMENILQRMWTGRNRNSNMSRLENRVLDWLNNSVGVVMFLNARSAVLQTISATNFINWTFNNPLKAGQAFANQPQFWKDFLKLMNSDYLVNRRSGVKINVNEAEIANAAAGSKNKAKAVISYLLSKGFALTQIADSFAIASGGATFFRNRVNDLVKKGMDQTKAEETAMLEWRDTAEESQQSSDPSKISQQQASSLGRVVLAFVNTPMQYNRLMKKAFLDLVNGRGSAKANISRITYYGFVQNLIFTALQNAVFALAFGDDEEDDAEIQEAKQEKYMAVADGMLDNILRGTGIAGAAVTTLKAIVRKVIKESKKEGFPGPDYDAVAFELLNFSPPIDIKASRLRMAGNTWKYQGWKHEIEQFGINDPAWEAAAYAISAVTNVPLDRLYKKIQNVSAAMEADQENWKRVALLLGWSEWQLETPKETKERRALEKQQKKEIKAAKVQDNRTDEEKEYDKIKDLNKPEQVRMLDSLGLTKAQIRALKYEEDRIKKILELTE